MNHTASLKTHIEPWPKFRVLFDAKNDRQKAYLELNAEKNTIGYNLRADYCSFWGSYLPKLLLDDDGGGRVKRRYASCRPAACRMPAALSLADSVLLVRAA